MARKKVITDDDVKALEEELEKKKSALADMREKLNMSRIDNFKGWCKRNGIDPMQFLKLAITEEFSTDIKSLYCKMTAEPVGLIKPVAEAVKFKEKKEFPAPATVEHSEAEEDDNQDEEDIDSDDDVDEDDNQSDSENDIDEDIDYSDEESDSDDDIDNDSGQQKLWN